LGGYGKGKENEVIGGLENTYDFREKVHPEEKSKEKETKAARERKTTCRSEIKLNGAVQGLFKNGRKRANAEGPDHHRSHARTPLQTCRRAT